MCLKYVLTYKQSNITLKKNITMEYSSCKKAFSDKTRVQWDATLLIVNSHYFPV